MILKVNYSIKLTTIVLRPANIKDIDVLYKWVNNSDSIKNKLLTQEKIAFSTHKMWLENVLKSDLIKIFIIERRGNPIGNIKVKETSNFDIDIFIIKSERNKGYAKEALNYIINLLIKDNKDLVIEVNVSKKNISSLNLFNSCGFKRLSDDGKFYKLRFKFSS